MDCNFGGFFFSLIMYLKYRTGLRVSASLQVFQVKTTIKISLHDVEDALTASRKLRYDDKKNYFYSNGIDYDNVEKYYDFVMRQNEKIKKTIACVTVNKLQQYIEMINKIIIFIVIHYVIIFTNMCNNDP